MPFDFVGLLLKPFFFHFVSAFLHLMLLVEFPTVWVCNEIYVGVRDGSKQKFKNYRYSFLWSKSTQYRRTLFCALGASAFNLVMCLLYWFLWYGHDWSYETFATLLDLAIKTVAWGIFCACLSSGFFNPRDYLFPLFFRAWCAFYLLISCYCFVLDIILFLKHVSLPIQYLISDGVSSFVSVFFCYVVFFVKHEGEDGILQEPLLTDVTDESESNKIKGEETVTPYSNAGIFSKLTFSWVGPLIAAGKKKTLDLEDVPQLASCDSVVGAFPAFRNKLEADCGTINRVTTTKLVKSLILSAWTESLTTAFLALLNTLASYVGPSLIDSFVQYLSDSKQTFKNEGYFFLTTFFVAKLIECLTQRHCFFRLQQIKIRIQALLVTMIYGKILTLSSQSKQGHTTGEIIDFITVDAERVANFSGYIHDLWTVVLHVVSASFILYKKHGMAFIAASFVAYVVLMLANIRLGSLQEKFQDKLMESKDRRMKTTAEILRNMSIVKLQGWEMKFLSKVIKLRETEEGWLRKYLYTLAIATSVSLSAPTLVAMATFGTCTLLGIPLESGKFFSSLATFYTRQDPINSLPSTISMIVQTKVSLDRIASFLSLDELQSDVIEKLPRGSSNTAIEIVNGNFLWDLSSPNTTLKVINLTIMQGMRVAICGAVGSGKSRLLSCILGEVPKISGILRVCGTKAFVTQSPWIQSGTIEENILFGKEMDGERYEKVLKACCLKKDLEILPFHDQTIIGERGINLSGGQKQRIQIARALYQDADIYLFDDPFSAVDVLTGSYIFQECILGLPSSKTVIYITHQVEFLHDADLILVMKDGKITQCGKYDELRNSGTDFKEIVGAHRKALSALGLLDGGEVSRKLSTTDQEVKISDAQVIEEIEANEDRQSDKTNDVVEPKGQLIQEEEREKGNVGLSVYWKYITTANRGALVPFILLAQILFQVLQIGSSYWMAWATPPFPDVKPPVGASMLIIVYVAMVIGSSFCILAREMLLATAGYKTATILFNRMHSSIFRAPMSFFNATPNGRIINRASTDQSEVDITIPYEVGSFAFAIIEMLGTTGLISSFVGEGSIISILALSISFWCQRYYLPSARELSRLVGVCKAPIIQHSEDTFSGTTTIRGFNQESRFQETNMKLMDGYSRPLFNITGATQWLGIRLDIVASITYALYLIFVIFLSRGVIDPSIAGLMVYQLDLNTLQECLIWNPSNLENKIISLERILQYISCIPSEPPFVMEENQPNPSWPSHGEVDIRDLKVRYAPRLPLVVRGITCKFPGGLKTAIIGRTGSGKTTLTRTLFRIIEPSAGQIVIDGIDIASIGLHDLRSRLSIIPQVPTMFEGTVRTNLDPLEEYTDEQIWDVLDKCKLGDEVQKKDEKLDSAVSENGENWSMGQRQLLCLGRVLLKRSKVLVLDEATASVDTATDNWIQQILRQHFSDCTIITVAHRITSILNSDMVLLLDQGLVKEYDSLTRLLQDKSSSFARLVAEYTFSH